MVTILWIAVVVLVSIGIAMAARRTVRIFVPSAASSRFPEAAAMDAGFASHPWLTMVHIVPGALFLLLAPFQFVRRLHNRRPGLHRWMGRVALVSGTVTGVTALVMGPRMAIGGVNETAATTLFAIVFLFALLRAFLSIRAGRVAVHREWMIRAFAVGLAVATIRPIVGAFFATRSISGLTPHEFFGTAFWLGFTIHLIAAEMWIDYSQRFRNETM